MKKLLAAIAAASLVFISGCTQNKITSGEVIDKEFTPAHSKTRMVPVTTFNGKTSSTILVPYVYHYSDNWEITIRDYNEENNELTATYRVTEDIYNSVDIGDEFVYQEDFEPDAPEYTGERSN